MLLVAFWCALLGVGCSLLFVCVLVCSRLIMFFGGVRVNYCLVLFVV